MVLYNFAEIKQSNWVCSQISWACVEPLDLKETETELMLNKQNSMVQ